MLRSVESYQDDTVSKVVDLGKFQYERTWPEWEVIFGNYISTIPGVNGVPLSYTLLSQADPDRTTDFQGDFIAETISCIPLSGNQFQSDTRKVHQLLKNYLMAETNEQYISSIENNANGWDDFDFLRLYYSGEGNYIIRIATADRL